MVDGARAARFPERVSGWGWERRLRWVLCVLATALLAREARATTPSVACQQAQIVAARELYRDSLRCWSKDPNRDPFDTLQCLAGPEQRFDAAYARAATSAAKHHGSCGLKIRVEALLLRSALDVDRLDADISAGLDRSNADDRKLRAKLLKASAGFAAKAFAAERSNLARPDALRRQRAYDAARARLTRSFSRAIARAQARQISYASPDATEVADRLEAAAAYWASLTNPNRAAFAVGGTVFAAESTFVDSDVNDVSTDPVFNGTFAAAQVLPAPAMLGGYVNLPGTGPPGNLFDSGDRFDTYAVNLAAGQVVVLVLGDDPAEVDLDICVYGEAFPSGACSQGTGSVELVSVPADGEYFIDVFPFELCNCGSNYVLAIAQSMPAEALRAARTDVDFVPGELVVRMKPEVAAAAAQLRGAVAAPSLGLETVAGDASRELLVRLPANLAARSRAFSALGVKGAHDELVARSQSLSPEAQLRRETILAMKALQRRPDVASAELNTIAKPALVPSDPLYTLQWHYPLIHLPQAWDATTGDPNVIVAVVDTGVVLSHPDLQGQLVPGYDFISSASRARDGDGIDPNPEDPGDLLFGPGASSFHGTHVTGTIGAASDNALGVAGVAWGARVMPVRVLGVQGGTLYDILQGVRFAAGLPNDSGTVPAKPASVINLSLAGGGFSQLAQDLFTQVHNAEGVVVVAAAGNDATNAPAFPASYDDVISVSAVDLNQRRAVYSNYGPKIDIAAPGGDTSVDRNGDSWADGVLSTMASDASGTLTYSYAFSQGTSMAAPHVSGVVALMKSINPALSPKSVDDLLGAGLMTEDLGTPGRDDFFGYGLVDAQAAVLAAGAAPPDPTAALTVTPSGLNFGVALVEAELELANASSDPLTITSISNDASGWLTVEPVSVDAGGLGRYRVSVDRAVLTVAGTYAAGITIESSAGTTRVPVVMRVGGPMTSDAGYHFVALVDAQTLTPLDEIGVAAVDGAYPFQFENVPAGDYLLVAGTDLDNDGFICDGGEACGSYPTLDVATPIHLDHDVAGADFGTGFRQSIGAGPLGISSVPALH